MGAQTTVLVRGARKKGREYINRITVTVYATCASVRRKSDRTGQQFVHSVRDETSEKLTTTTRLDWTATFRTHDYVAYNKYEPTRVSKRK